MERNEKEQFKNLLKKIKDNDSLIKKLSIYLEEKNLLQDLYFKLYYMIEKSEPIYKINYYKSKINGKLLSMSDVENSYNLLKDYLDDYVVYVYDEIKTLHFKGEEIYKKITRCQEYSKSYNYPSITIDFLSKDNNFEDTNWINIVKENPLLFSYIILDYNIDMEELSNIDQKSYTYKKEIKKN